MAGKLGGDNDQPLAEINVVPLVDVILVVLIIFMVTAPLVLKPSIEVNLPQSSSGDQTPPTPLTVSVTPSGTIEINGKAVSLADLTGEAQKILAEKPETPAILAADKSVTLEVLTQVIDAVKKAGVKKVAFSIDKKN